MKEIKIAKFSDQDIYIGEVSEQNSLKNAMRLITIPDGNKINIMMVPALYPVSDELNITVNIQNAIITQIVNSELEKQYISAITGIKAPSLQDMIKLVRK